MLIESDELIRYIIQFVSITGRLKKMLFYLFKLCLIFLLPLKCICDEKIYGYVLWDERDEPELVLTTKNQFSVPSLYSARAIYHNEINQTGWAYLELHTTDGIPDTRQAFAGGYLEGFLTHELIWMAWMNTVNGFCKGRQEFCDHLDKYTAKNYWYIQDMIYKFEGNDPYWHQINLIYLQIKGMFNGYNKAAPKAKSLTYNQFLLMNMNGDLEDLQTVLGGRSMQESGKEFGNNRCSALIKLLSDRSDILVGHTTWTVYETMLRIQKKYVFNYHVLPNSTEYVPSRSISMSSYPGYIHSADDFYVLSSKMVTTETTISNDNSDLWPNINPVGQVLEFIRTMVANRMASSGIEWTSIFRKFNSGTYNNQWLVVDYKRFNPKYKLKSGVLWVLEQLPGYIEAKDLSSLLEAELYFGSYNTPYFPLIFNMSGQIPKVAKYGDWFTYDKNPRALIFKRDQVEIKNLEDMMNIMRYNDFKNDPLSACNCTPPYSGENSIAARSDLNMPNGTYPFSALKYRDHGASDAKVINWKMALNLQFKAVSSPPFNETRGIPPFRWSTAKFEGNPSHLGHPDTYNFTPITHDWEWSHY